MMKDARDLLARADGFAAELPDIDKGVSPAYKRLTQEVAG